jgi:hypothetical protein
MTWQVKIRPAVYYAGLDRPFYVSRSAVEERARAEGFSELKWHKRELEAPPVDPKIDPRGSDDWDEWISARYAGPERVLELPQRPAWFIRGTTPEPLPAKKPEPRKSTTTTTTTRDTAGAASVAVLLIGGILIRLWVSRRA